LLCAGVGHLFDYDYTTTTTVISIISTTIFSLK